MKIKELNEIVDFFKERQDTDEGKSEYYRILLQSEQIRILSEIRKGLKGLGEEMREVSNDIVGSIESRLWPLVSLYELEDQEEEDEKV